MSTEGKIFLGIIFFIIAVFGYLNFEIAVDSHNISIANQNKIDSLEYRISLLEYRNSILKEMQK